MITTIRRDKHCMRDTGRTFPSLWQVWLRLEKGVPIKFVFQEEMVFVPHLGVWASVELVNIGAFSLPGWSPRECCGPCRTPLLGHASWFVICTVGELVHFPLVWHNLLPPSKLASKQYTGQCCAAAAAKSLQSCPTLCDPIDGSPPGSPVPGILQARTLEWVAISFSNVWKWKVKVKSLSRVWLFVTAWTAAHQAPPSMGFSRRGYWSGVPSPSPSVVQCFSNQWMKKSWLLPVRD